MNDIDKTLETKEPVEKASELLYKIAVAEIMLNKYADAANIKIEAIKNDLAVKSKLYVDMLDALKTELNNLAEEHKEKLFPPDKKGKEKKKLSLMLKFGEFGFKKTTTLDIPVESYTVQLIEKDKKEFAEQTGVNLALTREPKINKKALQSYGDDVLKEFGINRKTSEIFFYTSNPQSVEAELAERK
jgi:hypothetical protein